MSDEHDMRAAMESMAEAVNVLVNGNGEVRTGFVMMIFPYGDQSGRCHYFTNGAQPEDVKRLCRKLLTDLEQLETRQ